MKTDLNVEGFIFDGPPPGTRSEGKIDLDAADEYLKNGGNKDTYMDSMIKAMGIENDPRAQALTVEAPKVDNFLDDGKGQHDVTPQAGVQAELAKADIDLGGR